MATDKHITEPEKWFYLKDGRSFKSMRELLERVKDMEEKTFRFHHNQDRHDFSNWVKYVFEQPELADKLKFVPDKEAFAETLAGELNGKKNVDEERNIPSEKEIKPREYDEKDLKPKKLGFFRKLFRKKEKTSEEMLEEDLDDRIGRVEEHAEAKAEEQLEEIRQEVERSPDKELSAEEIKDYSEKKEEEYSNKIEKLKEEKNSVVGEEDDAIRNLKSELEDLRQKVSELRKQGKSTFYADFHIRRIPAKIQLYKVDREEKDLQKIKRLMEQVEEELEEVKNYKEVDVKREVEEMANQN